jgi:predicted ester cyclase
MAAEGKAKRKKGPTTVVREYLEALSAQDLDRALAVWKPGAIDNLHGVAELRAPEGIREYFTELFRAFPDFRLEVVEIAASGELAAARWRTSATFNGPGRFQGFAATGARVEFEGADFFRVVDEQIVANNAYTNAMFLAQQLGILPPAGSPAERAMAGAFNAKTAAAATIRRLRQR